MSKSGFFNPTSWFDNIYFSQKGKDYVYSLTDPNLGSLISAFNGGYSEANMMVLFQSIPELFFPVNAIASRVKNGIYKLVDDKGEEVTDNKLWNQILQGPNWEFSFSDFIWHAVMYKLVTGNRYGYAYVPSSMPVKHKNIQALWMIPSHYVNVEMKLPRPSYLNTLSAADYVKSYIYYGGDMSQELTPETVVHEIYMKVGDATDIITGKGVSPFKAAEYPLSNIIAVYSARNVIYVKRGPLGAIVSAAKDASGTVAFTPKQKQEVVDDLTRRYGLGQNQSPFAVTNQPVDYKKFGSTIQELEPFRETEASAAALCGCVGVPMALMPKGQDAKFTNLDIAERNLYENVIIAEADDFCQFITRLGRFGEVGCKVVVSFEHVAALQDDKLKNAQAFSANANAGMALYKSGIITENELRARIDYEAIEGGDDFATPVDPAGAPAGTAKPKSAKKLFGTKQKFKKQNCFNNGKDQ